MNYHLVNLEGEASDIFIFIISKQILFFKLLKNRIYIFFKSKFLTLSLLESLVSVSESLLLSLSCIELSSFWVSGAKRVVYLLFLIFVGILALRIFIAIFFYFIKFLLDHYGCFLLRSHQYIYIILLLLHLQLHISGTVWSLVIVSCCYCYLYLRHRKYFFSKFYNYLAAIF